MREPARTTVAFDDGPRHQSSAPRSSGEHAAPRTGSAPTSHGGTSARSAPASAHGRETAVSSGARSRGDRPAYGVASDRTHPPHTGDGGHGGGYYPWYSPWYPYGFGFAWDPFWWGAPDPGGYPGYGPPVYAGGGPSDGYGGLRLKVKPSDGQVYVDGYFAGVVSEYDGAFQKLKLEVGPHHIEVRAPGYETLGFDVNTEIDQTTTYQGELQRAVPGQQ
jgi:hypothetical protein